MADYYPLIARAVGGLDKNTGENRRTLYDRARAALVAQLRSSVPPLQESEITRERLALEEAVRRVEAEAMQATRGETASPPPEPPAPKADPKPDPAPESESEPKSEPDPRDGERSSLRDEGLRNFREVMAEAEDLGGAAAHANKSARDALDHVPAEQSSQHVRPERPAARIEKDFGPPPPFIKPPLLPEELSRAPVEPRVAAEGTVSRRMASPRMPPPPPPLDDEAPEAYARPARSYRGLVRILILLLVVAGVAGAGYWQRGAIKSAVTSFRGQSTATAPAQREAAPEGQPKISDRVGPSSESPSPSQPATSPSASVAQKVVLYDEDPNNPQGKRYVGSAIWRTETVSPGTGLAPELAIRADVEIPERHMRMTWSLRRNTDKALPASHTIEIMFTLPADFSEGGIANIPGVLMKTAEQARGVPLAGLSVKVTNGYFLIGLSAVDVDVQRNVQFLKERDWFDIPIVYTSGKRAILAMEKGPAGVRAFQEAFKAWGQ